MEGPGQEHGNCLCLCSCAGCTAVRESMKKCQCTTCQLFGLMPLSQDGTEHRCFFDCINCRCKTCEAVLRATRECDCVACLIIDTPQS